MIDGLPGWGLPGWGLPRRGLSGVGQHLPEVSRCMAEAGIEINGRRPTEDVGRHRDVGATLQRIILWQRTMDDPGAGSDQADDAVGQFAHRYFMRVADI